MDMFLGIVIGLLIGLLFGFFGGLIFGAKYLLSKSDSWVAEFLVKNRK